MGGTSPESREGRRKMSIRRVMPVAPRFTRCAESRGSKVAFASGPDQNRGVNLESFQKTRIRRWDAVNGCFDDR
ncbi:hypothetical protein CSX11_24625 [Mycobacterium goodii]|nr:hypothetical protein CSX11_24625 [Mycolicibacterium goodii]